MINYDTYQSNEQQDKQQVNNKRTTNEQQVNTNNKDNNVNNGKKETIKKKSIPKKKYLEFVKLTDEEYKKLIDKFGESITKDKIQKLDDYVGSKGTKYVSHYRTILNWSKKDAESQLKKPKEDNGYGEH